jgi:phosphohistidine phosphatase SixA
MLRCKFKWHALTKQQNLQVCTPAQHDTAQGWVLHHIKALHSVRSLILLGHAPLLSRKYCKWFSGAREAFDKATSIQKASRVMLTKV